MNLKAKGKESMQCRESRDMKILERREKRATDEEKTCRESKRYLIGFGMLTKTSKSLYAVHYE